MTRPDLQNVYPRKRLFTRISQHISQSAVWICGPAGCGKTTLVNSYLKEENLPCLWYDVDERDADISSFFYSLGRAAQQLALEKRESFPLLTREYFRGLDVFTRNYFNLLCQSLPSPFAVVLDSFQEAGEDSITNDILGHAIDILILNNIYFFICSRTHPPQHLIRERARGRLEVMGWNQLKLNCQETEKIICCTTGKAFPESAVRDLHQKTDGWVSGLILLLKTGNSEDISPHMLSLKTPEEIFDYIGTMIFKDLSVECQPILMNLSYLGRISKNSFKKYNNKHTKALLDRLVRKNAFTYKSVTDPVEYFFHPLFLEFLQKQASQTLSPLAHRALLNKSAALLEEEGKKEDAVNLCIKAENFSKAADLVIELAPRLFDQFRIMTLEKWITALPDQIHQKTPWLLFWRGACQMPFSPESAGPFFKKALTGFEKRHIPEGCFMAVSGILDSITYQFNVFQEIDPWLDKYNELENRFGETKKIDVQLKLTISMLNALVHRSPESHAMKKWTQKGWQLLLQIKDVNSTFQIFVPIIILKIMQGDHPAAAHLIHMFDRVSEEKTTPLPFLMLQELKSFHFWLTGKMTQLKHQCTSS